MVTSHSRWQAASYRWAVVALIVACSLSAVEGRIHDLTIVGDARTAFLIEPFGFVRGGTIDLHVKNFKVNGGAPYEIGFIYEEVTSEEDAIEYMDRVQLELQSQCPFSAESSNLLLSMNDAAKWSSSSAQVTIQDAGMYAIAFVRCVPAQAEVNFEAVLKLYNPGPNYLSAGNVPLPPLYLAFACLYCVALGVWIWNLRKNATKVHTIHHMMSMLVVFKLLSLFFESIMWFNIKSHGAPIGWNVLYYIFAFLKGTFLFIVVLLIGTGWSLLKPFLSDKEKRILVVVLTLQVLDNIAIIVVGQSAPGSISYLRWEDILHIVDLLCCCAVLVPIVWSIRHLRQAAGADGKARNTLSRLTQFRHFYIMVIGYIYFTRIIVLLVSVTLAYDLTWLGPFFAEIATLIFFVSTGYKFRPAADNPYLRVRQSDDEDEDDAEFGLDGAGSDDDDGAGVEMVTRPSADAKQEDSSV